MEAFTNALQAARDDAARKAVYDSHVARVTDERQRTDMFKAYAASLSAQEQAELNRFFLLVDFNKRLAALTTDDARNRLLQEFTPRAANEGDRIALFDAWYRSLTPTGRTNADRFFAPR
jgi:hypothetical protein